MNDSPLRQMAGSGALALLLLSAPRLHATIDLSGDQLIAQNGDTISDTYILANGTDIGRITGGEVTLSGHPALKMIDSSSFIMTGGNVYTSGEIEINRNVAAGDVLFEIHGGKFNTAESTGVHLSMPFAANGKGGDSGTVLVTGGELHLDRLQLSSLGGDNNGTSYTFTQTGGTTKFRELKLGIANSPSVVNLEISGGTFINDHSYRVNIIDKATFHVNGSAATEINFWSDLTSTANARFQFTIDGTGVSPITLNSGLDDILLGTVDLGLSGAAPANGTAFTLFSATSGGDIYSGLTLDPVDASDWTLQVNGNNLEAVYSGAPPVITTVEIISSGSDSAIKADGTQRTTTETQPRIGRRNADADDWVFVMPFQLPDLNGGSVVSAQLAVNIPGTSTNAHLYLENLDLYASTLYDYVGSVADSQFYVEGYNPVNPDVQLITDNIATDADIQAGTLGVKVSTDVGPLLQSFYNAGAQPGAYVYFILTNDQYPSAGFQYYKVDSAQGAIPPTLTVDIAGSQTIGTNWGTTSSITSNGVTWTFSQPVTHGTFITGDFWVVGPVTITSITNSLNDPAYTPRTGQNGTMVNPLSPGQARTEQGYDDGIGSYNAALNVGLPGGNPVSAGNPLVVATDSTVVSSVSWLYNSSVDFEPGTPSFNGGTGTPRPVTRAAGVLTVLDAAPADYSFRPPYAGTDKTVNFQLADVDAGLLLDLAPVGSNIPSLESVEDRFSRPWIDHVYEYLGAFIHPSDHMNNYGQNLAQDVNNAALLLNLDFAQLPNSPTKDKLLVGLVQLGIDNTGIADNGGGWHSNGGHGLGRKLPILMAGLLLDNQHMKDVGLWGQNDGTGTGTGVEFQEFQNTFYVDQAAVDLTQSGLIETSNKWPATHPGVLPGGQWEPDYRNVWDAATSTVINEYTAYTTNDIGTPDWGIRHSYLPAQDNGHLSATYRSINASVYPGIALIVEMMGARSLWNDESFMDYSDRYMGLTNDGTTNGGILPNFVHDMWVAYRANYSPIWPNGSGGGSGQMVGIPVPADGYHYDSYAELAFDWPTNHGEGSVCLWGDDKLAALSITIDDNNAPDVPFWMDMSDQFGWKFTWFLIVHETMWDIYNDVPGSNIGYTGAADTVWKPVYDAGHETELHGRCGQMNSLTPQDYVTHALLSIDHLEDNIFNEITTFAYPCGEVDPGDGTESYKTALSNYLIAARGTSGGATPIHSIDFMETHSMGAVSGVAGATGTSFQRLEDDTRPFAYSQYRGWGVMLYHHVDSAAQVGVEEAFTEIKANEHKYYIRPFSQVARYAQERMTSTLTINSVTSSEIRFTLTDEMLDSIYYQPLTVKLRVNGWTGVSAIQNGLSVPAQIIQHNGDDYVLVDAIPDNGQVIVSQQ